jgi:uncharacterized membrane protein YphA (DoxX/SURF4 family)
MKTVKWLVFLTRVFLGVMFLIYGTVKLCGGQFYHGDFVIDSQTTDGTSLVWCFFGWSYAYTIFIGLSECAVGLLLLIPPTATLGAVALFPLTLNITVMDFCFQFPAVKYTSLLFTTLCALLLLYDWRKLAPLLWDTNWRPKGA